MNAPTNIQILKDAKGKPAFAVIPYAEYISLSKQQAPTIPNAVVNKVINKDMTPIRAWREHLGLTQTEVARRLGISQSAYAQQEAKEPVRKSTREKIAQALGIVSEQLAI
ncbi:MAG: DNA-binding protein [Candidatus Gallionella acididurans]|uniref:DNA-binding protein n=1 Tax=Candidatus Gallionella acididurans TaxID=1796491 RepID=A0A139BRG4_9PROT|nr:MAG: DNA-binding protein [Candidatus Gallionella acididurans]